MTDAPGETPAPFVLVVDDNLALREVLQEILQYAGYRVGIAANASQAHQILEAVETPPQLIISDLLMPKTDGYQFMLAVRREETGRHIPFLFISGQEATYLPDHLLTNDIVGYLSKPFAIDDLLTVVARVIREE